jgi:hypothetical protein
MICNPFHYRGDNSRGQLGIESDETMIILPQKVPTFENITVFKVICVGDYTAVLVDPSTLPPSDAVPLMSVLQDSFMMRHSLMSLF